MLHGYEREGAFSFLFFFSFLFQDNMFVLQGKFFFSKTHTVNYARNILNMYSQQSSPVWHVSQQHACTHTHILHNKINKY